MDPVTIGLIISALQAAIVAAPKAMNVVVKAKEFIGALGGSAAITKAQQDAVFAHLDSISGLVQAGIVPASWQVEEDPEE